MAAIITVTKPTTSQFLVLGKARAPREHCHRLCFSRRHQLGGHRCRPHRRPGPSHDLCRSCGLLGCQWHAEHLHLQQRPDHRGNGGAPVVTPAAPAALLASPAKASSRCAGSRPSAPPATRSSAPLPRRRLCQRRHGRHHPAATRTRRWPMARPITMWSRLPTPPARAATHPRTARRLSAQW